MTASAPLRVGMVGAGATRRGLGPFLAAFAEQAGGRVVAVAGRNAARAAANAAALAERLHHPVSACADVAALCAEGLDAWLICSPAEHHLGSLQAAVAAGVPVLCEKPLVASHQGADGAALVERFAARGLVLMENCQWPDVLPALDELYPGRTRGPARSLVLGLGPSEAGAAMVTECLSHLLSLAQAVAAITPEVALADVVLDDPSLRADRNVLRLRLRGGRTDLSAELHLQHCPEPPRPAWLAVDGARMDRRIGQGYSFTFTGNGREVPVPDPTPRLVAAFLDLVRAPVPARVVAVLDEVRQRLRLYHAVLARLGL